MSSVSCNAMSHSGLPAGSFEQAETSQCGDYEKPSRGEAAHVQVKSCGPGPPAEQL